VYVEYSFLFPLSYIKIDKIIKEMNRLDMELEVENRVAGFSGVYIETN